MTGDVGAAAAAAAGGVPDVMPLVAVAEPRDDAAIGLNTI
jgi:hypothetical protein